MANAAKGHAALEVAGKTYTLAMTLNALCEIEERFGGMDEVESRLEKPRMSDIRALLFCALQEHHAEEFPDERAVGSVVSLTEGVAAVTRAMQAAFPTAEGGEGAKPAGKPPARPGRK